MASYGQANGNPARAGNNAGNQNAQYRIPQLPVAVGSTFPQQPPGFIGMVPSMPIQQYPQSHMANYYPVNPSYPPYPSQMHPQPTLVNRQGFYINPMMMQVQMQPIHHTVPATREKKPLLICDPKTKAAVNLCNSDVKDKDSKILPANQTAAASAARKKQLQMHDIEKKQKEKLAEATVVQQTTENVTTTTARISSAPEAALVTEEGTATNNSQMVDSPKERLENMAIAVTDGQEPDVLNTSLDTSKFDPDFTSNKMQASRVVLQRFDPRQHIPLAESKYDPDFTSNKANRVALQRFDPRQHIRLAEGLRSKTQQGMRTNDPTMTQLNVRPNSSPSRTARIANVTVKTPAARRLTFERYDSTATTTDPLWSEALGRFGYPKMLFVEREVPIAMGDEQKDYVESEPELLRSLEQQPLEQSSEKNTFNPRLINHLKRVAKVKRLKDAYDGKHMMTFQDLEDDADLMAAFIDNMDYLEENGDDVFCRKTGSKKSSEDIAWRLENYATITDLKHFALTEPWPQTAIPITLIDPRFILCLETVCAYDTRLRIHDLAKKFLRDGGELTLAECTYGSTMLMAEKIDESIEYLRVVALSYNQIEEGWLVAPIDSTHGPPMKVLMTVSPDSLYLLPDVISLQAIPALIFIAPLRGLTGIKPGALDLARNSLYTDVILTVKMKEQSCIVLPFWLETSEEGCPIDLTLINENNDGALEGRLVSEILYCKSLGIPIGPIELDDEHPFWMGNRDVELPRLNLERMVHELAEIKREDHEGSQYLGPQRSSSSSSAVPSIKEGFLFEDAMRPGKTIQQQATVSSQNVAKSKAVVVPGSIEKLLQSLMGEPRHRVMFRSMFKLLQTTSDVTNAELDYAITQCGCK